jgi:hypothetical protein
MLWTGHALVPDAAAEVRWRGPFRGFVQSTPGSNKERQYAVRLERPGSHVSCTQSWWCYSRPSTYVIPHAKSRNIRTFMKTWPSSVSMV